MTLSAEREMVAAACNRLAAEGLVPGTAGNASMRSGDHVAVTPTGAVLGELEPEQVTVVDLDGQLVDGSLAPTSELSLHLGVYRRHDARAVVHTHAPMATAIACVLDELPLVHYQMLALGGSIRVAPYATFGSPELAQSVVDALEGKAAALMQSHGAVCVGADVQAAADSTLLLEWACGVYWHARALGEPHVLTDAEVGDVVSAVTERGYGAVKEID